MNKIIEMDKSHTLDIKNFISQLSHLDCRDNIRCFLLYGSFVKSPKKENVTDTDIIVVVNNIQFDSSDLFDFIYKNFPNPDFHIYSSIEIERGVAYFSREYVMEYLSKALCLYGENIFRNKFSEITKRQYMESILIRSIEHVQMVRKVYFSKKHSFDYKLFYLKKYIIRLSKNVLLFKAITNYDTLDELSDDEVLIILKDNNLVIHSYLSTDNKMPIEYYYTIFCNISSNLIDCMQEIGIQLSCNVMSKWELHRA